MTATAQSLPPVMKPRIHSATLAEGLRAHGAGELWQEKSDGVWCNGGLALGGHLFNAEAMRGGLWVVNDLIACHGQDVRGEATAARWAALQELARTFPPHVRLCRTGRGGEFLRSIIADGGEGVVVKPLDAPFGLGWVRCKRIETFDGVVTEIGDGIQSFRLSIDGLDAGWCPCRSPRVDRLRLGDWVEVSAQCRHPSGKLREPRFVRPRPDKETKRLASPLC